jgi:PAS domain S-box-containing protein
VLIFAAIDSAIMERGLWCKQSLPASVPHTAVDVTDAYNTETGGIAAARKSKRGLKPRCHCPGCPFSDGGHMESASRPTGLQGVGPKPWGTHFCLFYETRKDFIDLLVPYFKVGLENQEFCLCVASEPVIAQEAESALRGTVARFQEHLADGQIEIVSHETWYLVGGRFDPLRVRQEWIDKLDQARARGYAGMRFAANVSWVGRKDWVRFADYEAKLDETFAKLPILAVCAYPLTHCSSADMLDVVRHHQFSLARRHGEWEWLEGPELQRARAEIRKLNADLERRVGERTAELAAANAALNLEIAERRRTEQSLQSVLGTLPVGVIVTDLEGNIVLSNAMAQQIWGGIILSGRERWAESKGFWHDSGKRVDTEDWASVRALREGQTSLNELIDIETFDGQKKTIQNSAAPVRTAEGSIQGAVVVNEDVTDRVRTEEALRESERKLHEAQRIAHIGYWERDIVADRITFSEEAGHIFGLREQIAINQAQLQAMIHPDDRQLQSRALADALHGRRSYEVEYRIIRSDGEMRFVHVRDAMVSDQSGRPIRMFGTVQDITERKRAEEALREAKDRSQHLSRRLLEVQEEERRHIARELHDEFGQTLTGLRLLLRSDDNTERDARIEQARKLVDELLDKVRTLSFDLRPAALDQLGLVPGLLSFFERYTEQASVQVEFQHQRVEGRLPTDVETTAYRVVQESLTNAARHAGVKRATVRVRVEDDRLALEIEDRGSGFDLETALGARKSSGLAGMRERVELLNGSLKIDASPGVGTRITVELPLHR